MKVPTDPEAVKEEYRRRWRRYLGVTAVLIGAFCVYVPQIPRGSFAPFHQWALVLLWWLSLPAFSPSATGVALPATSIPTVL